MKKLICLLLFIPSCTPLVYTPAETVSEKELQLYLSQLTQNDAILDKRISNLEKQVKQGLPPAN